MDKIRKAGDYTIRQANNDYLDDTRANLDIQLSQSIIAVFNGQKSGTKNTIDYAKKKNVQVVNVI